LFLGFLLQDSILPLLHTHLLALPEMYDNPEKAAHYHILDLYLGGFNCDPALGWPQSKQAKYF
jgi:hypothetical protein